MREIRRISPERGFPMNPEQVEELSRVLLLHQVLTNLQEKK